LLLIVLTGIAPIAKVSLIPENTIANGTIGELVPNWSTNIGQLQDKAYTYTGVDIVVHDYGVHIDNDVTIVVIDSGLKSEAWKALEENSIANVDVIGFLTLDSDGTTVKWITNRDAPYLDGQTYGVHGLQVVSVLASIARDVNVIFIDLLRGYESYGFDIHDEELWEWIDDNQATYGIDVINYSYSDRVEELNSNIYLIWDSLVSKNVMMLTSAGLYGTHLDFDGARYYKYPAYYTQWYCVGSIDHETRLTGDPLSTKNSKSSFSSWFDDDVEDNDIVNWLEPGNGIPVMKMEYAGFRLVAKWRYALGTSFSTPYLAAIVALIIIGYHNGIGSSTDPSLQKIIDILQYASSRSTLTNKWVMVT